MNICHYCKRAPGNTIDHIVPRMCLPKEYPNALPMHFHQLNRVPACGPCNNKKGHHRSDCDCERCEKAWALARKTLEPLGWIEPPMMTIEEIIAGRAKYINGNGSSNNEAEDIRSPKYKNWPYNFR